MITFFSEDCKDFSQDIYDSWLDCLPFHRLPCSSCGKVGCLIRYGRYSRKIRFYSKVLSIYVQRSQCKECRVTHALLPSFIVPCSQIPLHDQQEILSLHQQGLPVRPVLERNDLVDENHVKYIISQFRLHWQQRIKSLGLLLTDKLIQPCFSAYSRQFMQVRRIPNKLFYPPT